jgi:acetyl-CoA carboxylase biotin carboxyl carrier protein
VSKQRKPTNGAGSGPDLAQLEKLLQLMGRHQVAELEWQSGGEKLALRTQGALASPAGGAGPMVQFAPVHAHAPVAAAPAATAAPAPAAKPAAPAKAETPANQKQILSPFVGTFYRAPSPTADPYVREGQTIKRGDVLCIIEAMKLMNEIESEMNGKIVSVLVENGQPVEFGEPLFLVETS